MFNIFDAVTLAIVLLCAYFGYNTGIIASLFYMASGFAGMWAAHVYSAKLGMNFYLTFILAAAVVILIGFILGKIFKAVFLGGLDRLGGIVFGILLGIVIFVVIVFPLTKKLPVNWQKKANSSFSTAKIMPILRNYLPNINEMNIDTVKESMPKLELPKKISHEIKEVPKKFKKAITGPAEKK
jgi:membrane protein required for colicin V production